MIKQINNRLRILLITNALVLLSSAMFVPIYALYVEEVGGDLLSASYAFGAFALAAGITSFFSGRLTDKIKESEYVLIIGYALSGIGYFLYIFVSSTVSLLFVQIFVGIAEAIMWPAFDGILSYHMEGKDHATKWGLWESMSYLVTAIGAIVGGLIAASYGFIWIFVIMSILCFSSSLYLLFLPRKEL